MMGHEVVSRRDCWAAVLLHWMGHFVVVLVQKVQRSSSSRLIDLINLGPDCLRLPMLHAEHLERSRYMQQIASLGGFCE